MQPDPLSSSEAAPAPLRESDPEVSAPASLRLARRPDGKLWLSRPGGDASVEIVRCFPWTAPDRYLSLRGADGEELAFVADTTKLDASSRRAVEQTLARAGFVLEITGIDAVEEDFELRTFRVRTANGPRKFQTPLDGFPRELEGGGLVLEDVYGDLYHVHPPRLDPRSRKLLAAFVD